MCLSIPAKIVSVDGDSAEVSAGGTVFTADIRMIENPSPGEYILLHAGFAIQKINEKDAEDTLNLLKEMNDVMLSPDK
jgi:hydrogenase expression/formation protein HypC